VTAIKDTISQESIAKMLTYLSSLLPDTAWPFWPHVWLLSVSILAAFAVGAGIIFESSEYTAATHRVAKWLVLGGIAVESLCTVWLFVFDEGISREQQEKIIALELKLISRATLLSEHAPALVERLKPFPGTKFEIGLDLGSSEQNALAFDLETVLAARSGWTHVDWNAGFTIPLWIFGAGSGISRPRWAPVIARNVEIHVPHEYREQLDPAAKALISALNDIGIVAADAGPGGVVSQNEDVIHIWIGDRQ
jgi:hypothetical protein